MKGLDTDAGRGDGFVAGGCRYLNRLAASALTTDGLKPGPDEEGIKTRRWHGTCSGSTFEP